MIIDDEQYFTLINRKYEITNNFKIVNNAHLRASHKQSSYYRFNAAVL